MITPQAGLNLAYWVWKVHPELFAALLRSTGQTQPTQGLGSLGQDGTDIGTTTTFDTSAPDVTITASTNALGAGDVISQLSPDLTSLAAPDLANVSIDPSGLTTPSFSTAADTATASSAGGVGSAIGSALSSVGSFLTSVPGLTSLSNLATAIFKANTPQASTINAQVARVQAGANPAPITYGYNAAGQLVPILQTPSTNTGFALTPSSLSQLIPSSITPYLVPVGIGLLLWWALAKG
jgi:hypothetical protein